MKDLLCRIKHTMPKEHRAPHEAPAPPPPFDGDSEGSSAEMGEAGLDFPLVAAPPPPRESRRLRSDGSDISRDHENDGGSSSRSAPRRYGHSKAKHTDSHRRRIAVEDDLSYGSEREHPSSRSHDPKSSRRCSHSHSHTTPAHPRLKGFLTGGSQAKTWHHGRRERSWSGFLFDRRENESREKHSEGVASER